MTDCDLAVVERYVSDLWRPTKSAPRPPVALSDKFDRIEIDLSGWANGCDGEILQCRLAQELGRRGYWWDIWIEDFGPWKRLLCVSEKETEE